MASKIEIANLALTFLSANTITAFEDDSDEARLIRLHYPHAKDATLEAQEWSFARKRFKPAKNAESPLFGYANAFTIPSDIVRVIACDRIDRPPGNFTPGDTTYQPEQVDWQVEDNNILSDQDVLYVRGITNQREEGTFSPLFVHALAAKLAVLLALPLTQSNQILQNMAALYDTFITEAKSRDALQGRSKRIRQKSMLRAR